MPAELAQWITPAMFILGLLYLDRSIRNMRTEFCQDIKDLRVEIVNLRDHMDAQHKALPPTAWAQSRGLLTCSGTSSSTTDAAPPRKPPIGQA